jgi:hypothetical protein
MMSNQGQACEVVAFLAPVDAADTAAATSGWVDCRKYEGDLVFTVMTGVVDAGSVTWTFEHATAADGSGNVAIVPTEGALTAVTTSNDPLTQKCTIPATAVGGWVKVIGTIVTGGALVSVSMLAHPKYV